MKLTLIAVSILCCFPAPDPVFSSSDEVVSRFLEWERTQEQQLTAYECKRRYALSAGEKGESSVAEVQMSYRRSSGETFQVQQWKGAGGVLRFVLKKILDNEADVMRPQNKGRVRLTEENYRFELVGTEDLQHRPCYVLKMEPRRKQKYSLEGRVWIDRNDYGLVRLQGQVASNSFWIGQPSIVQNFGRKNGFALLEDSQWTTKTRGLGTVSMRVDSLEYEVAGE